MNSSVNIVINGWRIFAHPLFLDEIDILNTKFTQLKNKNPTSYHKKNASKRLAAITELAFTVIPKDPTLAKYRQGSTLGDKHKHWFRAKFFQQYRLFFRFNSKSKIIVFCWVNNEKHKRVYNSKTDAYHTFNKMLKNGNPPDSWNELLKQAKGDLDRFNRIFKNING